MKRWYLCAPEHLAALHAQSLIREHHYVDVPGSGEKLVAIHFLGVSEMQTFEKLNGIAPLGHVVMNKTLPPAVATALSGFGVANTDGTRDAIAKIVSHTGMHQLTLGEM